MDAFLSLGSNLGDRLENLKNAEQALKNAGFRITESSSVYETEPWGFDQQGHFLNKVVRVISPEKNPDKLLAIIKAIERACGRTVYAEKWQPRIIDIDILYLDSLVYKSEKLSIPHPGLTERMFVLVPLLEIAPDWIDPENGLSVEEMYDNCKDELEVYRFDDL
jgi:2-amino-4-hydroxy-6-hydroxymethyldihydropteridine diphosphokinase